MRDSLSVITNATEGIEKDLAKAYDLTVQRIYEMLGNQCTYPKTKRLIREIAAIDKERVRLIKADLDAMFCEILGEENCGIDVAEFHRETSQATAALLENKPRAEKLKEVREMVAVGQKAIVHLETGDLDIDPVRTQWAEGKH